MEESFRGGIQTPDPVARGLLPQPLGSGGGCWDCDVLTVTGLSAWMMMMERLGELPPKGEFKPLILHPKTPLQLQVGYFRTSCFRP
jgi:hypothetical protein